MRVFRKARRILRLSLFQTESRLFLFLTRRSLADRNVISEWKRYYSDHQKYCLFTDCITGYGIKELPQAVRKILSSKIDRYMEKGMTGRAVRAMVVGIPNVGKSTLINRLAES